MSKIQFYNEDCLITMKDPIKIGGGQMCNNYFSTIQYFTESTKEPN